jgi:putative ABC transport system substrate-binding protein
VRRRDFAKVIAGLAAWPFAARAQQPPVIGYLANSSPATFSPLLTAFRRGLSEVGYVEGQNVAIEYPGGNATGVLNVSTTVTAKRLALLRELVPTATLIAVLRNPASPDAEGQLSEVEEAARTLGQQIKVVDASSDRDFGAAFATIVQLHARALFVSADPLFTGQRAQLAALAAQHAIPASYSFRELVIAGGLMSYGAYLTEVYRQAGVYTGRILKGEKPADLPVLLPTKFELVINLKTAQALGLKVPQTLIVTADEVIE